LKEIATLKDLRILAIVLAASLPWLASVAQEQPPRLDGIHVEISRLRNDKGQVLCSLFSSAADFPKKNDKAVAHAKSDITHGKAACDFASVAPGTYAVSVFHDENSNGKMDTNLVGMPREGVGASNNPKPRFGPPKFDAAAFRFSGGRLALEITIHYL
jgi:uncharacterized protein (DUF2141 family)